jgi:hypothetical protein
MKSGRRDGQRVHVHRLCPPENPALLVALDLVADDAT